MADPTVPDSCGGQQKAESIFEGLVDDQDFQYPDIDLEGVNFQLPSPNNNPLYENVSAIDLDELTERKVKGDGVFDALMETISAHLKHQFEQDRISGREYAEVYTAAIQGAMAQAVGFLLGKDNAYWQAMMTQAQAKTAEAESIRARVELENTKLDYITKKAVAKTAAADFAIKKLQLALMDQDFCQKLLEKEALELDIEEKQYRNDYMLDLQKEQVEEQINQIKETILGIEWDNQTKEFTVNELLPIQKELTEEQIESTRAQTLDTRRDGTTPVTGLTGKQKDLYTQQITSYQRDAEVKAAKMFLDSWVTQKTIDEALVAPDALKNASIETVMSRIKVINNLD